MSNIKEISTALHTSSAIDAAEKYGKAKVAGAHAEAEKRFRQWDRLAAALDKKMRSYDYEEKDSEGSVKVAIRPHVIVYDDSTAVQFNISVKTGYSVEPQYPFVIKYDVKNGKLAKKESDTQLQYLKDEAFKHYHKLTKMLTKLALDSANMYGNKDAGKYTVGSDTEKKFDKIGDAMRHSVERGQKEKIQKIPAQNITLGELKKMIFESICEFYQDRYRKALLKEDQDKEQNMIFKEGDNTVLPDSMDQMLSKFPTLKHCLIRIMTEQFTEFVSGIDWISPRPTEFRINLKNGQNFTLKWLGKDFEATISGKKYYLGQMIGYQQALNKLSELYQEGPMGQDEEAPEGSEAPGSDMGGGAGGGGDFPGAESGPGAEEVPSEGGEEEEGADVSDEDIDFEEPAES